MEKENTNKIQSGKYIVSKRKTRKTRLSKQNYKSWQGKYSTTTEYNTFTIKVIKKGKINF